MPVILSRGLEQQWLKPNNNLRDVLRTLRLGKEILDFIQVYVGITIEGEYEVTHYRYSSYSLELDVISVDRNNVFQTDKISEEELNK